MKPSARPQAPIEKIVPRPPAGGRIQGKPRMARDQARQGATGEAKPGPPPKPRRSLRPNRAATDNSGVAHFCLLRPR
jgi:hypothetical protein